MWILASNGYAVNEKVILKRIRYVDIINEFKRPPSHSVCGS